MEIFDEANEDLNALQYALTATNAEGILRVPPRVSAHLLRAVTGRSRVLPGLARQAIRLAVALDYAGPNNWLVTLHSSTDLLRKSRFSAFFKKHPASEITWRDNDTLSLSGPGLDSIEGEAFQLDLKRTPILGAYLDLAAHMLGFKALGDLVDEAKNTASAEAVGKKLHDAILAWLHPRLQREHLIKQATCIRTFLINESVRTHLDVKDETILSFWEDQIQTDDGIDGFRMWTNAVTQMMAYRRAMSEAADARGLDAALSLDFEDDDTGSSLSEKISDQDGNIETYDWVSPLFELTSQSQDAPEVVKWIASKEARDLIGTFLTDRAPSLDEDAILGMNAFADGRPDITLIRTWLRYVSFGARQRSLVQHARTPTKSVQAAEAYLAVSDRLNKHLETIAQTYEAASWALLSLEPKVGFMNFLLIDRKTAMTALNTVMDGQGVEKLTSEERYIVLKSACDEILNEKTEVVKKFQAAHKKVNRKGFKDEDQSNPEVVNELARGTLILPRLLSDIRKLNQALNHQNAEEYFGSDNERFEELFGVIYAA